MKMNVKMGTYTRNNESFNFNFYTNLTFAKKKEFVDSVVSILVDDSHYNYIIRDLVFDFFTIDIFTDIDTTEIVNSPNFLDDVEQLLEETNIIEIIRENAYPMLFDELDKAVDKSVQYLTGIYVNPLSEALAGLLSTIDKKVNEVDLDNMMNMAQQFAGMTEDFTLENAINYYMNSDMHKQNLAEIEEAKQRRAEFAKDMDNAIKIVNKQ